MNIIGQPQVLRYLTGGLQHKTLSPSLLFVGPDGVGKKLVALDLAKSLCGEDNVADLLIVNRNLQAILLKEKAETQTTIKIDSIRHLDQFLHLKSLEGGHRVVIIEETNKLTPEASNALLKLLEEPPPQSQLILLSTDEHNMLPTVVSRCAVLHFKLIASKEIAVWLEREHAMDPSQAEVVADLSGGSFSKALELKDEEEPENVDLASYSLEDFFGFLAEPIWKKEGRARAEKVLTHLTNQSRRKLEKGDMNQTQLIQYYLEARRQLDHNVNPRLVLENMYLKCEPLIQKEGSLN